MIVRLHVRPAARSAAVRPHSSFLPSPRPAMPWSFGASPCRASLFFAPAPRPVGKQSLWRAGACSRLHWEHRRAWERFWEHEKRLNSAPYATVPTVPTPAGARVIRSRARALAFPSLSLGTWEQSLVSVAYQWLGLFPRLFPASRRVGTWEQQIVAAARPDRLGGRANKVEPGYGDLRRAGGDAGRKFRGAIALAGGAAGGDQAQLLELGARIGRQLTRRGENGGKLPLSGRVLGHVGRAMLEGAGQGAGNAAQSALRLKLGRLHGLGLGSAVAAAIEQRALGSCAADFGAGTPGAPNAARATSPMLALDAAGIWIEHASEGVKRRFSGGEYLNRLLNAGKNAQIVQRRRGPGGAALWQAGKSRCAGAKQQGGERAGVNSSRRIARPHEAGEFRRLGRVSGTVKGLAA